jgi:hypothetical protein
MVENRMIPLRNTLFHRLAWVALALTFVVVVLGAYVRLSDAGLGCPDWPGCYGHWMCRIRPIKLPRLIKVIRTARSSPPKPGKKWFTVISPAVGVVDFVAGGFGLAKAFYARPTGCFAAVLAGVDHLSGRC